MNAKTTKLSIPQMDLQSKSDLQRRLNQLYDHNAPRYDNDRAVGPQIRYYFDVSYQTLGKWIGPTAPSTLHVDMPVGTGRFFLHLRKNGWTHRMLGLDISRGMVSQCQKEAAQRGQVIHLSLGDAFSLPLENDSVDILSSLRLFHLFPEHYWPDLIAEMRRVVRPGGFLITEFRNMIRGKACTLLGKSFRNRRREHPHYFLAPHKVGALFGDWRRIESRGIGMDGSQRAARIAPLLGRGLYRLEQFRPFCYLSKTLLVKAYK